jgi:hypothetical protein
MHAPYRAPATPELLAMIESMIELSDRHANRPWEVPSNSIPLNVLLVHSSVQHVVNLSRGIVTLYRAGQAWEAIPSMRVALECAVTAAWCAVAPDQTGGVVLHGAKERKQLLKAVAQFGIDTSTEVTRMEETIDRFLPDGTAAAEVFLERTREVTGGETFYTSYRTISRLIHPGTELADFYTEPDDNPANHFEVRLLAAPAFDADDAHSWLGHHACMMVIALRAAESRLVKPRHRSQIERWAKKLGGIPEVSFAGKAEVKEQTVESFIQSVEGRIAKRNWEPAEVAGELRRLAERFDKRAKTEAPRLRDG